jgi:hypothetical protein
MALLTFSAFGVVRMNPPKGACPSPTATHFAIAGHETEFKIVVVAGTLSTVQVAPPSAVSTSILRPTA